MRRITLKDFNKKKRKDGYVFVVEHCFEWIDDTSFFTDDLTEAIDNLKETNEDSDDYYYIYVFKKEYVKNLLNTFSVWELMLGDLEDQGIDPEFLQDFFSKDDRDDFETKLLAWFEKRVKDAWVYTDCIGQLKLD